MKREQEKIKCKTKEKRKKQLVRKKRKQKESTNRGSQSAGPENLATSVDKKFALKHKKNQPLLSFLDLELTLCFDFK